MDSRDDRPVNKDLRFNPKDYTTNDFEFVIKKDATSKDFFVMGGCPNTTKEIEDDSETNRGYYVRPKDKTKEELIETFKKIQFKGLSSVSGGVAWFNKVEIVKNYLENS